MAHVMSSKVKTNIFLIWCGPDGDEMYDIDYVMEQ